MTAAAFANGKPPAHADGVVYEAISITGATVTFDGVVALSNVSASIGRGEIVGIIGPNGAGKTTLLNAICGLVPLSSGKINILNSDIAGLGPAGIARLGLARTFQTSQVFRGMTVLENVMSGLHLNMTNSLFSTVLRLRSVRDDEEKAREAALAALDFVGMRQFADRWGTELSFGQQRLVELARALVRNPTIILLDEPAVGLSVTRLATLSEILKRIRTEKNITLVLIEHVLRLVMGISDKILVLNGGARLAEGSPKEIVANSAVVEAYLGRGFYASREQP